MTESKCIYCLKEKPLSEFNREHVVPECLGRFTPTNFILYETVCKKCNSDFGNNLEIALGRDSVEGVHRYKYGIKPEKEPNSHKRVTFKIPGGAKKGMYIHPRYSEEEGVIDSETVPQVGFQNKLTHEYEYFKAEDLPPLTDLERKGYETNKDVRLIAKDAVHLDRLVQTLEQKGIKLILSNEYIEEFERKNKEILIDVEQTFDKIMIRAFSKIAFNYLAFIAGKNFVLKRDFDDIRDFIRYGHRANEFLRPVDRPILLEDRRLNVKTVEGHLITLRWKGSDAIVSHVSLFNELTYEIVLTRSFKSIWIPISSGHCFNLKTKKIDKLLMSRLVI